MLDASTVNDPGSKVRLPHNVRSYNQGMYDTLVIGKNGWPSGRRSLKSINLFDDCLRFPNGTHKVRYVDTNMSSCGYLGTPLILDLYRVDLFIEDYKANEDVRKVLRSIGCRVVIGHDTTFKEFTPSTMVLALHIPIPYRKQKRQQAVLSALIKRIGAGDTWPWRYASMVDEIARPIRINSTTSFRVEVSGFPVKRLSHEVRLKFVMSGMLHKGVFAMGLQ